MTTLTLAGWVPRGSYLADALEQWAEQVNTASNGALSIEIKTAGELVGAFEVGDAVAAGQVDLGFQILSDSVYPDFTPATFPYLAPVNGATAATLFENLPRDALAVNGQTLLAATYGEPLVLVSGSATPRTGDDLAGLKIYAPGSGGELLARLGALVVTLPLSELYAAMATGVIDAALVPASVADANGLSEVADTILRFENDISPPFIGSLLTINTESLKALPDDLATLLEEMAGSALSRELGEVTAREYSAALDALAADTGALGIWDTAAADALRGAAEDSIDLELSTLGAEAYELFARLYQIIETGTAGADIIAGTDGADVLRGLAGRDLIRAGKGDDLVEGGDGRDKLFGDAGRDELIGGKGNDLLVGGRGADDFIFAGRFGDDRIRKFDTASREEDIDLSGVKAITSWRDLTTNHLSQNGDHTVIEAGNNSITLLNTDMDDLSKSDFLF